MTDKKLTAKDFALMTDEEKAKNYKYLSDEEYSKYRILWDSLVSSDEPYDKNKADELRKNMKHLKNNDLSDLPEDDPMWVALNKIGYKFNPKSYKKSKKTDV